MDVKAVFTWVVTVIIEGESGLYVLIWFETISSDAKDGIFFNKVFVLLSSDWTFTR